MNDRSFKDRERILEEIISLFFNILYLWTTAYISSLVISYYNLPVIFVPTSYVASFVYLLCTWGALRC